MKVKLVNNEFTVLVWKEETEEYKPYHFLVSRISPGLLSATGQEKTLEAAKRSARNIYLLYKYGPNVYIRKNYRVKWEMEL